MTKQTEREAALCDAAYVAGAQAGFNASASPDPMALHKLLESRAGYLEVLKRTAENPTPEGCTPAARDVLAERARQQTIGYNHPHDDEHTRGEIAQAAADWLMPGQHPCAASWAQGKAAKTRRMQLVIGTAMALAEIERMDRAEGLKS